MDVFDLAAKISLDTGPFAHSLGEAKDQMLSFKDVFKANIASDIVQKGFNGIVAGTKAVVGGLKNLVDQSQQSYGDFQQMVGGVQKLYGNMGKSWKQYSAMTGDSSAKAKANFKDLEKAQNLVLKNADKAYQTSGMSANSYMETATQFSASLISSLGGDTVKAAKQTDIAMRAISDNFNTFGGNIEDVTNAFKGFSKQNYTMLDNLKLGYGGTKTEMQRLIKDANEWGKANGEASNLSINSFSDVVTAIEQIQEKQQIAGTTAREASTTLQGSMGQMKAAWENLKTALADPDADLGKKVDQLVETITGRTATVEDVAVGAATNVGDHINGYLDNLLPVISKAIDGIANLISNAAPIIAEQIPNIIEKLVPPLLTALGSLADAVITNLPTIVKSIEDALSESFGAIGDPSKLAEKATEIISGLAGAITAVIPNLISVGAEILTALIQGITDNSQALLSGAAEIITALGNGIIQNLPQITEAAVEFIQAFTQYITDNKDKIQSGIVALVGAITDSITELAPELADAALAIVTALGGGLIQSIPEIVEKLPEFVSGVFGAIGDAFTNGSNSDKAAIALALTPIISGGIGDAISGIKDVKELGGKFSKVFGKIFGGDNLTGGEAMAKTLGSAFDPEKASGIEKFATAIGNLGSKIGGGVLTGLQNLGGLMTGTVLPAIGKGFALLGPYLPLIAGIAAAIVGIILVIKNWDKIQKALLQTWDTIKTKAGEVFGGIKDTISGAWDKVKSATTEKWAKIKGEVEKNGGGIKGVIKTAAKGYLKPWKAGFEALNKASGGKLGEAVRGVERNLKVMKAKFKAHNAAMKVIAKGLVKKVKEGWSGIKEAGGNFVKGLWKGINDKVGWITEKVKGFGKKVLKGLKDFFKIKSPSRVMRDEVGVYLAEGVAAGIKKGEKTAVKAARNLANNVLKESKKLAKKAQEEAEKGAKKAAEKTAKRIKKASTTKAAKATAKKVTTSDPASKQLLSAAEKDLKTYQSKHKTNEKFEAAYWAEILKNAKKGSDEYKKIQQNYNKALSSIADERLQKYQDFANNYAALHNGVEMTTKEQMDFWKTARSDFKKGSKQWIEVENNFISARKTFNEGVKSAFETFKSSMNDAKSNLVSSLQSISDSIDQQGETLRNSLGNWYEKFDSGDPVSAAALWDAQKSQKDAEEMGSQMLEQIRGVIGEDSPFFKTLQDMGYKEGVEYYKALLSMGPEGLKAYAEGEDELLQKNKETAKILNADDIAKKRADAINEYMKSYTEADKTLAKSLTDLGTSIDKTDGKYRKLFDTIINGYTDTLSTIGQGMSGDFSKQGTKEQDASSLINKILPSPEEIEKSSETLKTAIAGIYTTALPSEDNEDSAEAVEAMNSYVTTSAQGVADIVTGKASETTEQMMALFDDFNSKAKTKLDSIATMMHTSGVHMMESLISGMQSKLAELQAVVNEIASIVQANLGFSEPKEGPLSNFHTYAPDMMDLFASGIKENGYKISDAFDETLGLNQPTDYGTYTVQADPNSTSQAGVNQILSTLNRYLPQLGNQSIYLDGRTLVGSTASRMNEELAYVNQRRAGAFA